MFNITLRSYIHFGALVSRELLLKQLILLYNWFSFMTDAAYDIWFSWVGCFWQFLIRKLLKLILVVLNAYVAHTHVSLKLSDLLMELSTGLLFCVFINNGLVKHWSI